MSVPHAKRIALIVAVLASSVLMWWSARQWLALDAPFSQWHAMLFPAFALVLFGAIAGLALMLLDRWVERSAALFGAWASFVLFWPGNIFYLSVLVVFAFLWWQAIRNFHADLADRHTIRVMATLSQGMKYLIFTSFMMVSLGFYLTPHAQDADARSVSTSVQQSVDDAYQSSIVQSQLAGLPSGAQAQIRSELNASIDRIIREWLRPVAKWIPPLLSLGLFLLLWSANFLFLSPAVWLGGGIFWILRRTGFVRIETVKVDAQKISL